MTAAHVYATCILLIMALFIYGMRPSGLFANHREEPRLDHLLKHKDRLLENMQNLNIEHYCGNCTGQEFLKRQAQLEIEASRLLAEIVDVQRHSA
jgi:hypothetical protein